MVIKIKMIHLIGIVIIKKKIINPIEITIRVIIMAMAIIMRVKQKYKLKILMLINLNAATRLIIKGLYIFHY